MIQELAEKIVDYQITRDYLDSTERNKYVYAYEITINQSINLIISFAMAVIFREVYSTILFFLLYIPIRKYAGGFHASSNEKCILFSSSVVLGIILLSKVLKVCNYDRNLVFTIDCMLMIYVNIAAPVETSNKKISFNERRRYKKYIHIITLIHLIFIIMDAILVQLKVICIEVLFTYFLLFALLFLEQVKRIN